MASRKEIGKITLQAMSVDKLMPANYNPRTISEAARKGLSNSIERFGLVQPIIWNTSTGNVVGGHQRLKDLKERGVEVTDVVIVDLPEHEEKALNIALNHQGLQGSFLEDGLQDLIDDIGDDEMLEDLNIGMDLDGEEWDSDIDEGEVDDTEATNNNLKPTIKVKCNECDKAEVLEVIQKTLSGYSFEGIEIS